MDELNDKDIIIYQQIKDKEKSFEQLLLDNNIKKEELNEIIEKLKKNDIIYDDGIKFKKRW